MAKSKKAEQKENAILPLSDQLRKLQAPKNDGRGVCCIREISYHLGSGRRDMAIAAVRNEWDKIANYPDIAEWLKKHELADQDAYVNK
jgi:hypothetical protein